MDNIWSCLWKENREDSINIGLVLAPTYKEAKKLAREYAGPKMKVFEVAQATDDMLDRGFRRINF